MNAADPILARVDAARAEHAFGAAWARACVDSGLVDPPRQLTFRVTETHYRPGSSARLCFEGWRPGRARRRYFFVQLFPSFAKAQARLQAALVSKAPRRSVGPAEFLVSEWCAVVWELPNGPRLRVVRSFLQRKAFRRTLERLGLELELEENFALPELLRYVPRKRAVLRWPLPSSDEVWFLKLFEPGGDAPAVANLTWLAERSGQLAFRVPALLQHLERRRTIFMQGLPGEVLTRSLERGELRHLDALGTGLASLHGLEPKLDRTWSATDELGALARAMEDVRRALPALRDRIDGLLAALRAGLERLAPVAGVPIHGNLFGDQILVDSSGGLGLVDWDDLAVGDREFDLGRMLAHARYLDWTLGRRGAAAPLTKLESLFRAYGVAGGAFDQNRLLWYTAGCVLMRAKISALRKLAPGWPALIERSIDEAEALVRGLY